MHFIRDLGADARLLLYSNAALIGASQRFPISK